MTTTTTGVAVRGMRVGMDDQGRTVLHLMRAGTTRLAIRHRRMRIRMQRIPMLRTRGITTRRLRFILAGIMGAGGIGGRRRRGQNV
jgi:hypothetical protein